MVIALFYIAPCKRYPVVYAYVETTDPHRND